MSQTAARRARKRILLVDDHDSMRKIIADVFSTKFDVCGQAINGQEAIAMVLKLRPDIVVLDVSMPVMGGIEAARRIRELLPTTKIALLSVDPSLESEHGGETAADAMFSKTSSPAELLDAIDRLLSS
jgi:DNA-binding NarL/FixJ family response regulator